MLVMWYQLKFFFHSRPPLPKINAVEVLWFPLKNNNFKLFKFYKNTSYCDKKIIWNISMLSLEKQYISLTSSASEWFSKHTHYWHCSMNMGLTKVRHSLKNLTFECDRNVRAFSYQEWLKNYFNGDLRVLFWLKACTNL